MSTKPANSRTEKSADLLRLIAAIGILALLAWFDGNGATTPTPRSAVASVSSP